ncbi:tyrosine-type recombinase/integrase [uncultured Sphingobacterium sp.]|uniref:tyrosine-type recombinase/integrase n=1 Tax=uncultured Sphingobacterium sp. TaxID=182688 RepID=UPI00374827A4
MEYYDLKVCTTDDLNHRSYVLVKFNGKRIKEYSGKAIGLDLMPNSARTLKEKKSLLLKLSNELSKAIEVGNYRNQKESSEAILTVQFAFEEALNSKKNSSLNKLYKRNLQRVFDDLFEFLSDDLKRLPIQSLQLRTIQNFLNTYHTSNTYYMDKRRDLGVLFSQINTLFDLNIDLIRKTDRRKGKLKLHQIYEEKQLHQVLNFLSLNHRNLYICCLLSYGCFLRPHIEIRNLKGKHFKNDCTEIHLSGDENKSGRIRVTFIPPYVRKAIFERVKGLKPNENLFTLNSTVYNDDYFSKAWTRIAKKMRDAGILFENQTIYSFRHTASVNVYKKTKDLHILQQLLGHSDMIVTLKYLRGLGVHSLNVSIQYLDGNISQLKSSYDVTQKFMPTYNSKEERVPYSESIFNAFDEWGVTAMIEDAVLYEQGYFGNKIKNQITGVTTGYGGNNSYSYTKDGEGKIINAKAGNSVTAYTYTCSQ